MSTIPDKKREEKHRREAEQSRANFLAPDFSKTSRRLLKEMDRIAAKRRQRQGMNFEDYTECINQFKTLHKRRTTAFEWGAFEAQYDEDPDFWRKILPHQQPASEAGADTTDPNIGAGQFAYFSVNEQPPLDTTGNPNVGGGEYGFFQIQQSSRVTVPATTSTPKPQEDGRGRRDRPDGGKGGHRRHGGRRQHRS